MDLGWDIHALATATQFYQQMQTINSFVKHEFPVDACVDVHMDPQHFV